jgi:hypothetical protein
MRVESIGEPRRIIYRIVTGADNDEKRAASASDPSPPADPADVQDVSLPRRNHDSLRPDVS